MRAGSELLKLDKVSSSRKHKSEIVSRQLFWKSSSRLWRLPSKLRLSASRAETSDTDMLQSYVANMSLLASCWWTDVVMHSLSHSQSHTVSVRVQYVVLKCTSFHQIPVLNLSLAFGSSLKCRSNLLTPLNQKETSNGVGQHFVLGNNVLVIVIEHKAIQISERDVASRVTHSKGTLWKQVI